MPIPPPDSAADWIIKPEPTYPPGPPPPDGLDWEDDIKIMVGSL